MAFSKVVPIGSLGSLTVTEADAAASVVLAIAASAGGGSLAGVATAKASVEVDASLLQLVDAALVLAEAKWPVAAPEIAAVKAVIDSAAKNI